MTDIDRDVDTIISQLERLIEGCRQFDNQPWHKDLDEALRYTRMARDYIKKRFIR